MADFTADLLNWGFWILVFVISYFIGTYREKAHLKGIVEREKRLVSLPALSLKCAEDRPVVKTELVMGSVVIGGDFFKQVVASLASVFGMRIEMVEVFETA